MNQIPVEKRGFFLVLIARTEGKIPSFLARIWKDSRNSS